MVSKLGLISLLVMAIAANALAANVPQAAAVIHAGGGFNNAAAPSALPGNGCEIPTSTTPKVLFGGSSAPTSGNRLGLYNSGLLYTVPNNTVYVACGLWVSSNTATTYNFQLGYNTSAFSNNSATGAGDVYYGASSTLGAGGLFASLNAGVPTWFSIPVTFGPTSIPFFRVDTVNPAQMTVVGYEKAYP